MFLCVQMLATSASASNPTGCFKVGVGLSLEAFRSDGVTPIAADTVHAGELIKYQADLFWNAVPSGNCYFQNGSLAILLPNGTSIDVTPVGGIPLIDTNPFISNMVNYVVTTKDLTDYDQDGDINDLVANASYTNGTSLLGPSGIRPIGSLTTFETHREFEYLNVSKNASPAFLRTNNWDINKSVAPTDIALFDWQQSQAAYTVNVTKAEPKDSGFNVTGTINITNYAQFATANVTGVSDNISGGIAASVNCAGGLPQLLDPNQTMSCTYYASLPDNMTRVNNVTVATSGEIGGGSALADVDFSGAAITTLLDEVNISDTNGVSWNFSDSGQQTYNLSFNCSGVEYANDKGVYTRDNTATIIQTQQNDTASVNVECFKVEAAKDAVPLINESYAWTINKSVTPGALQLFDWQNGSSNYTVSVTKTLISGAVNSVSGHVNITNPATIPLTVTGLSDNISGGIIPTVDCGVTFPYSLPAGQTLACSYNSTLPDNSTRTNNATATTTDGIVIGSATAVIDFAKAAVVQNDPSINVTDTNGGSWTFSDSGQQIYTKTFNCSGVEYANGHGMYVHNNTATILQTKQSANASVTVDCYKVGVTKSANPVVNQTFTWTINKSVTPGMLQLFDWQQGSANYTVNVTKTVISDVIYVSGQVNITNPSVLPLTLTGLSDTISGGITPSLDCGVTFPYSLSAGQTLSCTYNATLPDNSTRTNNVTATTTGDIVVGSATAVIDYANALMIQNGSSINVSDTNGGSWIFTDSGQQIYTRAFNCSGVEYANGHGMYVHNNTATILQTKQSANASVTVDCYKVGVTKSANPVVNQTFTWIINKTVTPGEWWLFDGDQASSNYTVSVTKNVVSDLIYVSGQVNITNPSVLSLTITGVSDAISGGIIPNLDCQVTFPHDLPAGQTLTCTYNTTLPDNSTRINNVTATTTGGIIVGSATAVIDYANAVITQNGSSIDVSDTNGGSWKFTDSGRQNYLMSFNCSGVQYTNGQGTYTINNTATIVQTQQSGKASVTVHCYKLSVNKTAATSSNKTDIWNITKTVSGNSCCSTGKGSPDSPTNLTLDINATSEVTYIVTVTSNSSGTGCLVNGNITIYNPNPKADANLNGVIDNMTPSIAASVTCPSMAVPKGGTLTCTYGAVSLPDCSARTNTATATHQNVIFLPDGSSANEGTKSYSGSAPVIFGPSGGEIDKCVDVTDSVRGFLGTVCANRSPKTYSYKVTLGPYKKCGNYNVMNTASFVTSDRHVTGNSTAIVAVKVPCPRKCACTSKYWTGGDSIPVGATADNDLTGGPGGKFFASGQTFDQVLGAQPGGNGYYELSQQFIAAKLNIRSGAPNTVQSEMSQARKLLRTYTPDQIDKMDLSDPVKAQFAAVAGRLADYNSGKGGVIRCDDGGN